jgi:hypothetical protein
MRDSEDGWAELRERGLRAKQQIAELVGGLIAATEAAALLKVSTQVLEHDVHEHAILAAPDADGQLGFPLLQFTEDGRVRPGIAEVAKAGTGVSPWVVLSILVDDVPDGSAVLLERLDDPAVLRDAVHRLDTYGEHVAA